MLKRVRSLFLVFRTLGRAATWGAVGQEPEARIQEAGGSTARESFSSCPRNGWQVDETYLFPAPGGEPLWRAPDDLAILVQALHPSKKRCNRRLPRITQRDASTRGLSIRLDPPHRAANRWVVPGSRLLPHVSAGFVMERIREGRRNTRQSGSPPGARITRDNNATTLFDHGENGNNKPWRVSFWLPNSGSWLLCLRGTELAILSRVPNTIDAYVHLSIRTH